MEIRGWRSFSNEGIVLNDLKHINIIIGPNNAGKSNLFKYFYYLRQLVRESGINYNLEKDKFLNDYYGTLNNLALNFKDEDSWAWERENISCKLLVNADEAEGIWKWGRPHYTPSTDLICLNSDHYFNLKTSCLSVLSNEGRTLLCTDEQRSNPKVLDIAVDKYKDMKSNIKESYDTLKYWLEFIDSLIFVDSVRHTERKSDLKIEYDFDGSNINDLIKELNITNIKEWVIYQRNISNWLSEILMEEIKIELGGNGEIRFAIKRGSQMLLANLYQLGTGVSQLFMLLSFLFLNKDKEMNVFIEEPECNLHAESLVKLINIFEQYFVKHCFFITTHSSVLIDQVREGWTISNIFREKDGNTKCASCDNIIKKYEVLDMLGIKASQLLQSNCVIWIEGASDRIYLNKWIKDLSNGELIEGKHYGFVMYGGANLRLYDILSNENYIDILNTSRYAYIICDSDKSDENDDLKSRVIDIINKVESFSRSINGNKTILKDYVKVWVTSGREIENYIPSSHLNYILSSEGFVKKYLRENNMNINVKVSESKIKTAEFKRYDSFDAYFSKLYVKDNGDELDEKQLEKVKKHYEGKKVLLAREVVKLWDRDNYKNSLDLKDKMNDLISFIRNINNI